MTTNLQMISLLLKDNKTTGITKTTHPSSTETQTCIYNIISYISAHSLLLGDIRFQLMFQVCLELFVLAFPGIILQKVHLCWQVSVYGFLNSRLSRFEDVHWEKFPQNTNSSLIFSYLLQSAGHIIMEESLCLWGCV